jgi:hypothetical protein
MSHHPAHYHADWGVWLVIACLLTIAAMSLASVAWHALGHGDLFPADNGGELVPMTVAPAVTYVAEPAG